MPYSPPYICARHSYIKPDTRAHDRLALRRSLRRGRWWDNPTTILATATKTNTTANTCVFSHHIASPLRASLLSSWRPPPAAIVAPRPRGQKRLQPNPTSTSTHHIKGIRLACNKSVAGRESKEAYFIGRRRAGKPHNAKIGVKKKIGRTT